LVRAAGFLIAVSIGLWGPDTGRAQNADRAQNGDVVARIGDRVITLQDLEERLKMLPDSVRQRLASGDNLKIFLHNLVTKELLALEAARQGLDKDPRVRARIEEVRRDVLTNAFTGKILSDLKVTEEEMAAYYAANRNEFGGKPYQEVRPQVAQKLRDTKSRQALQKVERDAATRWPVTTNEALLGKLSATAAQPNQDLEKAIRETEKRLGPLSEEQKRQLRQGTVGEVKPGPVRRQ
jgi:hypothetical protein